ncbi:uncharacterized protein LOC136040243 [Artemia franciscana]|uniref:uncharacterized protein LOC136040243 n=1 Tax=Artemia franciscana TaxID=6661 RepID=UPI0032DAE814
MSKLKVTMMINEDINYCLINAVREGNLEKTRELLSFNNPFGSTNLVILACEHNKVNILEYLLSSNGKILSSFSLGAREAAIVPSDKDETCHNAFYYAIRSCNVKLLDTLIEKWPGNYFAVHLSELDEILSRAYEELRLQNVLLSEEIETFVENKLIDLRFLSSFSEQDKSVESSLNNTRERIELVLQNIILLTAEYYQREEIDEKFLFVAKFIAQNIQILKRQLKCTYERLPWEEIEFCLIGFVASHIKRHEINLFLNVTLNKNKMLNHLENFAEKLKEEKDHLASVDIETLVKLPNINRERVVAGILSNCPQFGELYSDYKQIRDTHSLKKISDYIKLTLSADLNQKEGKLIIARALQFTGEHLKNTLESPKLSETTCELLLLSLPRDTRKIVIDLRNCLSHAYSLSKRIEIEDNPNVNFFVGVQNDLKRINDVITDIFQSKKIQLIRTLLVKIKESESLEDIKEVARIFTRVEFDETDELFTECFKSIEHDKLEKLIQKFRNTISNKTDHEKRLFDQIDSIRNLVENKSKNISTDPSMAIIRLKSLFSILNTIKIDHNVIRGMKFSANKILENIPFQLESQNLKGISELFREIYLSVRSRTPEDNISELKYLIYQIFSTVEFGQSDLTWLEKLRDRLNDKGVFVKKCKQRKGYNVTVEKYNSLLEHKLSELEGILRSNALFPSLTEKLPSYRKNKKLQVVVEMLVLDILSMLTKSVKHMENSLFFLDENTPLLTGKCLRNHLAHHNDIVDILSSDPSVAVISNAKNLIRENVRKTNITFGKSVKHNPPKLKNKYDQSLTIISNQQAMFAALKIGNLKDLKSCLRKGADINGRSTNSLTALHFAAQGPSLEAIKFISGQNIDVHIKDVDGQSALHVAAVHGKKNIVELLIRKIGLSVDNPDNYGKTALHVSAKNGHKDVVEVLLKNNASTNIKDYSGNPPLHYAVGNDYIDVAKILLEKEASVDINEIQGGFTSLHWSAQRGHFELVNFFLQNRADVNARTDRDATPLHLAALNGHIDVVKALIQMGADVNAANIEGCTPLHYATENGHEHIVDILIEYRTNIDAVDKGYNKAPLHYAAEDGHDKIVSALLRNNANANIATVDGLTPLHLAVLSCQVKIVATLLEYGATLCAKDKHNSTPLHYAAMSGCKAIAEILISKGAEINHKTETKETPLHIAALNGHKDIIELLLRNKAQVRAQDINGNTALHVAAVSSTRDVIDLLLQKKAEVSDKSNNEMTPLHVAASNGNLDGIVSLIENKAEVNAKAEFGLTPLYAAVLGGHKDAVNLLIKNKAEVNMNTITDRSEYTPLTIAVERGHKEIVEILVANGANVNVKCNKITPLISAIKNNNKEIVKVLIENRAEVNTEGCMALSLAALSGFKDTVEMLLKNKACINIRCTENNPTAPLHSAAIGGHTEIINLLITCGATVDAITTDGSTPLHFTAHRP